MNLTDEQVINYVKSRLGESYVDVELSDEDIKMNIKQALDKIAPYYSGHRYILGNGSSINLKDHPEIKGIIKVYNTKDTNIYTLQDYVFGGNGIMIYSAQIMDRLMTYTCYQMLYNELQYLKSISYKYVKPILYLDGYNEEVIIEALVAPTTVTDIEPNSKYIAWVKDYTLALSKETLGRIRSKYSVSDSPYQLDGAALLSEAAQEKTELESKIKGSIFIL